MKADSSTGKSPRDQVTVQCVTDYPAFQELQPAWEELHEDSVFPSIYNRFLFVDVSIKAYGEDTTQLRIFVLREAISDRVIAIFPLEFDAGKWHGLAFNEYAWACNSENLDKPYPVIRSGYHDVAWQTFLRHLKENSEWHYLFLRDIPAFLPTLESLPDFGRDAGILVRKTFDTTGPEVDLDGDWETFYRKHRSLRRKCKRLEKDFGDRVRFEIVRDDWEGCLAKYNELEKKTWKYTGGINCNPETQSFYRDLLGRLAAEDKLIFGFIYVDDKIIAADMVYLHRDTAYFPHACFDPEYHRYSPSMVGSAWMLRYLYDTPYKTGDYLCGYASYMDSWSDRITETYDLRLFRPGPAVFLRLAGSGIRGWMAAQKSRLVPAKAKKA